MGSRVSVVEKRLDETSESLRTVDRVKDKLLQHSVDMKALNQKVADLSGLLGVEDRFRDFVQVTKVSLFNIQKNATRVRVCVCSTGEIPLSREISVCS